jgi:hypothetical protein
MKRLVRKNLKKYKLQKNMNCKKIIKNNFFKKKFAIYRENVILSLK